MPRKPTEAQQTASRQNGAKSRGPTTPEGRARCAEAARNQRRRATRVILTNESPAEYRDTHQGFRQALQPATPFESALVARMASAHWRYLRATAQHTALTELEMFLQKDEVARTFSKIDAAGVQALAFKSLAVHEPGALRTLAAQENRAVRQFDHAARLLFQSRRQNRNFTRGPGPDVTPAQPHQPLTPEQPATTQDPAPETTQPPPLRARAAGKLMSMVLLLALPLLAAQPAGQLHYNRLCAACHGGDGNGGERAPAIVEKLPARTDPELASLIRQGLPGAGMPGASLSDTQTAEMVAWLRTLKPRRARPAETITLRTAAGPLEGLLLNQGADDLQLLDKNRRIRLLRRAGETVREVTSQIDWPTYHGRMDGNRYSTLDQIRGDNIAGLAPRWMFPIAGIARLQVTPVVYEGVMYVTAPNECYALDPGTGRQIWRYARKRTHGVIGDAGSGINRGVAISGGRLFMITDNAHIIALNRFTGALEWESEMADSRQNYGATAAPLTVGSLVISGISGGDEGVRGFLAAYDQSTGKEAWRFWTVPARGEPLADTWQGKALEHGCAATWLTGTYDPALDLVYWPTGNPCPDYNGDERKGDNLYSDTILALEAKTGKLRWHYQYTPHDLWDWDAQQPPVLVDANWQGSRRKLLLHANRNGFFYTLDRVTGKLLRAQPFVDKLTWASGIGADGRPILNPGQTPTPEGVKVCPAVEGATNWFATSYHPGTGYYYVQTLEKCNIFVKTPGQWEAGKSYYDGATRLVPGEKGRKILRAIDVQTGRVAWQLAQEGPANSWGGVLSTAGGVVFFGDDSGALRAASASTGEPLWQFPMNVLWKASPMTYVFDNRQYVAIAAGNSIVSFALPDARK